MTWIGTNAIEPLSVMRMRIDKVFPENAENPALGAGRNAEQGYLLQLQRT
jgi:hypothetical protein